MKFSDSIKQIASALSQFQGEVTAAPKDAMNPHFKKKYATLDGMITAIRPALAKCGLSFIQNNIEDQTGRIGVYTMLFHSSGENITFDPVYIPLDRKTAQGIGSALTYSRRYSLGTALGIATDEDDDGNSIEPEGKKYGTHTSNEPKFTPLQTEIPEQTVAKMTEETLNKIKNLWTSFNLAPEKINVQTKKLYKLPLFELTEEQGEDFLSKLEAKNQPDTKAEPQPDIQLKTKNRYAALFAAGKEKNLSQDQVKQKVYAKFDITSLTKLSDSELTEVTQWIKTAEQEETTDTKKVS